MLLKRLVCLLAILGMAGVGYASVDWTGAGDGWDFNNNDNWDDPIGPNESWRFYYKYYSPYVMTDVDVTVTAPIITRAGTIVNKGHTANLTIASGASLTMGSGVNPDGISYNSKGTLTVKSNATLDMRYGQLTLDNPAGTNAIIEANGELRVSTLRHDNGADVHVYGYLWIWQISRIAIDPGWLFNVYDGGRVRVEGVVPYTVWSESDPGVIGMYIGSTVELVGDHLYDYKNKVVAKEGVLQAVYSGGWTTITCVDELPEPVCNTDLPSDADADGDVDQDDFAQFQACYSGEEDYPSSPENCACFDADDSGKINAIDFATFTDCATGPGIVVTPTLAPNCSALIFAAWEANNGALGHLCGSLLDTSDWRCVSTDIVEPATECYMSYGPYVRLEAGDYTARLHLRIDDITGNDDDICAIDVYSPQGGTLAGPITLTRSDFAAAGVYQPFDIAFTNPASGFKAEFRVIYYGKAQLDLDKIELIKSAGASGEPGTPYAVDAFATDLSGWTASTWVASGSSPGTCAWIETIGNPPGSVKSSGAGATHGADGCTREGGIIEKAVDTTGKSNLWVHYDLYFACRIEWSGTCTGCSANWLEGDCKDKLVIYCSTDGGANWTLVEQVYAGDEDLALWYSRQVKLPAEADNNANVILRFKTQFNNNEDVCYIDNIGLSEGTPPTP